MFSMARVRFGPCVFVSDAPITLYPVTVQVAQRLFCVFNITRSTTDAVVVDDAVVLTGPDIGEADVLQLGPVLVTENGQITVQGHVMVDSLNCLGTKGVCCTLGANLECPSPMVVPSTALCVPVVLPRATGARIVYGGCVVESASSILVGCESSFGTTAATAVAATVAVASNVRRSVFVVDDFEERMWELHDHVVADLDADMVHSVQMLALRRGSFLTLAAGRLNIARGIACGGGGVRCRPGATLELPGMFTTGCDRESGGIIVLCKHGGKLAPLTTCSETGAPTVAVQTGAPSDFDAGVFGSSEFGASEFGSSEFGSSESRANEFGSSELGSSEFGSSESRANEFGSSEFGSSESRANEFGSSELGSSEFGSSESRANEFGSSAFGSSAFGSSAFGSSAFGAGAFGAGAFGASAFGASAFGASAFGAVAQRTLNPRASEFVPSAEIETLAITHLEQCAEQSEEEYVCACAEWARAVTARMDKHAAYCALRRELRAHDPHTEAAVCAMGTLDAMEQEIHALDATVEYYRDLREEACEMKIMDESILEAVNQ